MRSDQASILVVDDELELLEIFSAWLGRNGYRVFTAPNGAEALNVLRTQKVDLLLSDIRMPVMDGVTLVRTLNQMETPPPKIIFVTGYGNFSRREIFAMGVEALLDKPLSRPVLIEALDRCLLDSADKWLTPSPEPAAQRILLELEGLEDATAASAFALGRGGCCLACQLPLKEGVSIDLSVRFAREGLSIEAQGTVVWVDAEQGKVGIAFDYLHPQCRSWVMARINSENPRSFVPQG
ncbi:MAG: response regulator [Acidobacteriaceae bacterium]|jgi:CheY-like chemotaxis protein